MPTGALKIIRVLVAKRFFSQVPASKAKVTCRQLSWRWRSSSLLPSRRSASCAGRATFRGPVQSSARSAWWRQAIPVPATATESTEDIPSEGHYYLQRQTVDHTREESLQGSLAFHSLPSHCQPLFYKKLHSILTDQQQDNDRSTP